MAQRGNGGNKPAQRTSITAKIAGTLPGHTTGANKSTAASKPQPASTSLPASAPGTAAPSPSPAVAATASAPAQPKTPAKHASPPAKPPDPLQRILMTAAAKGLSAASTNSSAATPVQRPRPGRSSGGQGVVAAADDDPLNPWQRDMQASNQRRSSLPLKMGQSTSRPATAAQPAPFSPGGSKTPALDASLPRSAAASPVQPRPQMAQQHRHSLMHVPVRPDANGAAAPDLSSSIVDEDEDGTSHAPQPSLAQTLANARAMLVGFNISPPSTAGSPAKGAAATSIIALTEPDVSARSMSEGAQELSQGLPGRTISDDQATVSDQNGDDEYEDEDEGDEDDQNEDNDGDEGYVVIEDDSRQRTQDADEGLGPLRDHGMTRSWDTRAFEFNLLELQRAESRADQEMPPSLPTPSAFLLASAKTAGSRTSSQPGSRRQSASQDWKVQAEQSPPALASLVPPDSEYSPEDPAAISASEQDPADFDPDLADSEAAHTSAEDIISWETRFSESRQRSAAGRPQHEQPAAVAEQQAVTSQPSQPAPHASAASRAPPPQPSISQLQNYSAPKPMRRTVPNAYADLAAQPSMDEEIDAVWQDEQDPIPEVDSNAGDEADAAGDAADADLLGQSIAERDTSVQPSPQRPPLLHNLAGSGLADDWGEEFTGSRELDTDDAEQEDAALLQGQGSGVSEEPAIAASVAAPGKRTGQRKVSFLDAASGANVSVDADNISSSAKTTPGGVTPVMKAVVKRLSGDPDPGSTVGSSLKVHAVTFNMNTHLPTLVQTAALLGLEARTGHNHFHPSCDVYAVGTQESGGLKPWRDLISRCLGGHYVRLSSESLMAISLLIYVRRSLANECSEVSTSTIATGIGNVLGNKGAVGAALTVRCTRLLFICAHFAAHEKQLQQRNAEAARIRAGLFVRSPMGGGALGKMLVQQGSGQLAGPDDISPVSSPKKGSTPAEALPSKLAASQALQLRVDSSLATPSAVSESEGKSQMRPLLHAGSLSGQPGGRDVTDSHDFTIWMGDLNYRIIGSRASVDFALGQQMFELLKPLDQLLTERARGNVFQDFQEGSIQFPPTFKYDLGSDRYDTSSKKRIPSWTDRILWRQRCEEGSPAPLTVEQLQYNHVPEVNCSDHKPVYAAFKLSLRHPPQPRAAVPFWQKVHNMLFCYDD